MQVDVELAHLRERLGAGLPAGDFDPGLLQHAGIVRLAAAYPDEARVAARVPACEFGEQRRIPCVRDASHDADAHEAIAAVNARDDRLDVDRILDQRDAARPQVFAHQRLLARRAGHDRAAEPRAGPLDAAEQRARTRRVVLLQEREAPRRVEHARRVAGCERGGAAERACLRRVEVHDVRREPGDQSPDREEAGEVGARVDRPGERQLVQAHGRVQVGLYVPVCLAAAREREVHLVATCGKAARQPGQRREDATGEGLGELQDAKATSHGSQLVAPATGCDVGTLLVACRETSSISIGTRFAACLTNEPKSGSNMPCTIV